MGGIERDADREQINISKEILLIEIERLVQSSKLLSYMIYVIMHSILLMHLIHLTLELPQMRK